MENEIQNVLEDQDLEVSKIEFVAKQLNESYGLFIASPFERGVGVTVANSLRRILLSSIQGYAITAMRIEYANKEGKNVILSSEFELIYGMYEDTLFFMQNLKKVRLKLLNDLGSRTIFFEKKGEQIITAKDIMIDSNIEICNPDLELAHLNEEASIFIELQVSLGRGYKMVDKSLENVSTIGTIPIDAIFSPVRTVNFNIENIRVGDRTDYERFAFEIWTDGTIPPDKVIAKASSILVSLFQSFGYSEESTFHKIEKLKEEEPKSSNLLSAPIEILELSVRSSNCLKAVGIKKIGDLVDKKEAELMRIKNLGKKSIIEIQTKLRFLNLGLSLKKNLSYSKVNKEERETQL